MDPSFDNMDLFDWSAYHADTQTTSSPPGQNNEAQSVPEIVQADYFYVVPGSVSSHFSSGDLDPPLSSSSHYHNAEVQLYESLFQEVQTILLRPTPPSDLPTTVWLGDLLPPFPGDFPHSIASTSRDNTPQPYQNDTVSSSSGTPPPRRKSRRTATRGTAVPVERPQRRVRSRGGTSQPTERPRRQVGAQPARRTFPCPKCPRVCKSYGDLQRHLESALHTPPKHRCPKCNASRLFTRTDAVKRHMKGKRCEKQN